MPQLNGETVTGLARMLEERLADEPVKLASALVVLVENLMESADEVRAGVSGDVYMQRTLQEWDRNRARLQQQIERVFRPSIRGDESPPEETVQADVVEPMVRGTWPAWVAELPQYRGGVRAKDPLFPPSMREVVVDGKRHLHGMPVVATAASLWSRAHVVADFDREQGLPRLRAVLSKTVAAFEVPDDTGNEGEANVWRVLDGWASEVGKLAGEAGSALWASSGIRGLVIGGGVLLVGGFLGWLWLR